MSVPVDRRDCQELFVAIVVARCVYVLLKS